MKRSALTSRLIAFGFFFGLIAAKPLSAGSKVGGAKAVPELRYAEFSSAAVPFDEIVVREGLPRFTGKFVIKNEDDSTWVEIDRQFFYDPPMGLSSPEKSEISAMVLNQKLNFAPWSGVKFCGGFHGDLLIEWCLKGEVLAQAILCFSCGEAEFLAHGKTELVDQSPEGRKIFRAFFLSHREHRSTPTPSPSPPH